MADSNTGLSFREQDIQVMKEEARTLGEECIMCVKQFESGLITLHAMGNYLMERTYKIQSLCARRGSMEL